MKDFNTCFKCVARSGLFMLAQQKSFNRCTVYAVLIVVGLLERIICIIGSCIDSCKEIGGADLCIVTAHENRLPKLWCRRIVSARAQSGPIEVAVPAARFLRIHLTTLAFAQAYARIAT